MGGGFRHIWCGSANIGTASLLIDEATVVPSRVIGVLHSRMARVCIPGAPHPEQFLAPTTRVRGGRQEHILVGSSGSCERFSLIRIFVWVFARLLTETRDLRHIACFWYGTALVQASSVSHYTA